MHQARMNAEGTDERWMALVLIGDQSGKKL
jgi:hypothetical protein